MQKLKIYFYILPIFFVFFSCGIIGSDNPCRKHIGKQDMIDILTEVFLLEAHISHQQNITNIRDSVPYLYAGVFQKYDITAEEFEMAFECYLLDRDLMNSVFDEVLSKVSIARSKADEKREGETETISPHN